MMLSLPSYPDPILASLLGRGTPAGRSTSTAPTAGTTGPVARSASWGRPIFPGAAGGTYPASVR